MCETYRNLVTALEGLEQEGATLPMTEDEWYTRPDTVSYGIVSLEMEADALAAGDKKQDTSYQGSVDLFSLVKGGAGWVEKITQALTEHCGPCWSLNSHTYERGTSLYHWEWTFEVY